MNVEELHYYLQAKLNSYKEHRQFMNGVDYEAKDLYEHVNDFPELKDTSEEISNFIQSNQRFTKKLVELITKAINNTQPVFD